MRSFVLPLASVWVLCLLACSSAHSPPTPQPIVHVQAARVTTETMEEIVSGGGTLYPLHQASLAPKISSPVKTFYVNRGDHVHRGQLLAVLEDRDLAGAATSAQGNLDEAKANYTKTVAASLPEQVQDARLAVQTAKAAEQGQQKLYDSYLWLYEQHAGARKDVNQAEVALTYAKDHALAAEKQLQDLEAVGTSEQTIAAKGQVETARGEFVTAQAQLDYSRLRSPIDGVVADRSVYPGDIAQAGTPLITIMDVSRVIIRLHLPHAQSALLRLNDDASIQVNGIQKAVHGRVAVISPALDPNSTTVEVWVEAPNPDNTLQPGSSAQVEIVARTFPNATAVPHTAVLTDSSGATSVMVIGRDGRAHAHKVTTGIKDNGMTQILAGVHLGMEVVATGAYGLPDNTRVIVTAGGSPDAVPTQP